MERGRVDHGAIQGGARVHVLLGWYSEIIGGVTATRDPIAAGVHVVGILLAMAVHGVVLGHMDVHGSVHRSVLVSLMVVCADTVGYVVAPIAVVRVHNLRAAVRVFEQLCELPSRKVYVFMAIGGVLEHKIRSLVLGSCPRLSHISRGLEGGTRERVGKRPAKGSTSVWLNQSWSRPDEKG